MNELRICFEVQGLAVDENGKPCPAGMQISLGKTDKPVDYAELTKNINIPGILKMAALNELGVRSEDVKIITPAEYDTKYGD